MKTGIMKKAAAVAAITAMVGVVCLFAGSMPNGSENTLQSVLPAGKTAAVKSPQFRVIILNPQSGAKTASGQVPQASEGTGKPGPSTLPNYKEETLTLALVGQGAVRP